MHPLEQLSTDGRIVGTNVGGIRDVVTTESMEFFAEPDCHHDHRSILAD
jgi:hypothetical protein